jgi:hypothetical protein
LKQLCTGVQKEEKKILNSIGSIDAHLSLPAVLPNSQK